MRKDEKLRKAIGHLRDFLDTVDDYLTPEEEPPVENNIIIPNESPITTPAPTPVVIAPPAPPKVYSATDANTLIGANAAAASGVDANNIRTVTLPAGRYDLTSTIIIPQGTHDFKLDISNADIRWLGGATSGEVIRVGVSSISGVTWSTSLNIEDVTKGATSVTTKAGQSSPVQGTYYALNDVSNILTHTDGTSQINGKLELVKCTAVSGAGPYVADLEYGESPTGIDATLEQAGAARAYGTTARLGQIVSANVCRNIQIVGGGTGVIDTGGKNYGINAGAVDGLSITGVRVSNFKLGGIFASVCKDVVIEDSRVDAATASGSGQGYGFYMSGTRGFKIDTCLALKGATGLMRHGFIAHRGASDGLFVDCQSDGGSYDSHGMYSARLHWLRCGKYGASTVGTDFGNAAWLGGDTDVIYEDCNMGGTFNLHPNATGLTVEAGAFSYIRIHSLSGTAAIPSGGMFGIGTFTGTVFTSSANEDMLSGYAPLESGGLVRWGSLTFTSCPETLSGAAFRRFIDIDSSGSGSDIRQAQGELNLINCPFVRTNVSGNELTCFNIDPGLGNSFTFTMDGCTVTANASGINPQAYAMIIGASWDSGSCTVTNNTYHAAGTPTDFVNNTISGGITPTISGNTAGP